MDIYIIIESDRGADRRTAPFVWVRHLLTNGKRTCATAESGKRVARGGARTCWKTDHRPQELRTVFEYTGPTIAAPLPTPSSGTKTRSLSSNRPSVDGVVT